MSLETNDKKQYGAPDFERYYSGQMTAQEMHALEKAALDDPFLADAMEGYKATRTPVADAAWLKSQLEARTQKAKVVPLAPKKRYPFLRIAALLLLLAGAGWSAYYLLEDKKDTLALDTKEQRESTVQQAPAPAAAPDTAHNEALTLQAETAPAPLPATATLPRKPLQKPTARQETVATAGAAAPAMASAAMSDTAAPMMLRHEAARDVAAAEKNAAAPTITLQGRSTVTPNTFRGRVVDENNQGVPNASVSVRNNRLAVATDEEGYFSLKTTDTALKAVVGAIGYETQDITLNRRPEQNNIVLKENPASLSEVVVVRRGVRQRSDAIDLPQPVDGWEQYHRYLQKSRIPAREQDGLDPKGSVTLSFDVNRKGEPVNIKVDSSLSPKQDGEAIRLLKEGPKWKRKKNTRGKVTISF